MTAAVADSAPAESADEGPRISKRDQEVWDAYYATLPPQQRHRTFTPAARRAVTRARKAGYSQEQILAAVRGWQYDPWVPRPDQNTLDILLRLGDRGTRANIDIMADMRPGGVKAQRAPEKENAPSTTKLLVADAVRRAVDDGRIDGSVDELLAELDSLPVENEAIRGWAKRILGGG